MASFVQQAVDYLTLLVEDVWRLSNLKAIDRTNLEALTAHLLVIDEMYECIDNTLHRRQEAFVFQSVIKCAGTDACSGHMRANGVEGDVLLGEVFAVGSNETYSATKYQLASMT